jgi:hypothetical protein
MKQIIMKKITVILLLFIESMSFAQNAPIDFEPNGIGANWSWAVFENHTNPALEIITNPDQSGINSSATVAKFTALQSGQPWAGTESAHGSSNVGPFVLNESNSTIKIMVWKSVISDVGIKLISSSSWAQEEIKVPNTVINGWEELTFNFSEYVNPPSEEGQLDQIAVFPDFDLEGRDQDNIVYFDNITFGVATSISTKQNSKFQIYPNPVENYFNINGIENIASVRIYNLIGQIVFSRYDGASTLNVSDLSRGVYLVMVENSRGERFISKMLKNY